nr:hypothetical protein [uncultured Cellulosilyticum sp.]
MMEEKLKGSYGYQYGSTAHDYDVQSPLQTPSRTPSRRNKHVKKIDVGFALHVSLCGLLVFLGSFFYIHQYAEFSARQKELRVIKNEIRDTKSKISLTEAKMSEKLNLDYIRERASKELGMSEPMAHQIVYIELQKDSYVVYDH